MSQNCCSICFEKLNTNDKINIFNCKHKHHKKCIKKWNGSCPNCRANRKIEYNSKSKEFMINFKKIHNQIPENLNRIYNKYWKNEICLRENHNILYFKPYGVLGICENCYTIETFNLMH